MCAKTLLAHSAQRGLDWPRMSEIGDMCAIHSGPTTLITFNLHLTILETWHFDQGYTAFTNFRNQWWVLSLSLRESITTDVHEETIKWSCGNTKYKIYTPVLNNLELYILILHSCLEVKNKIKQITHNDTQCSSRTLSFSRIPSNYIYSTPQKYMGCHNYTDENPQENVQGFEVCICSFIASHSTAKDRHKLISQLQSPHKPPEIKAQIFYYPLCKVNGFDNWLPGNDPRLNEDQLKQALLYSMPFSWCECIELAGHTASAMMTLAEVLRYFKEHTRNSPLASKSEIAGCNAIHQNKSKFKEIFLRTIQNKILVLMI